MIVRSLTAALVLLLSTAAASVAADGAAIFKADCAKCHGDSGKSDTTMGKAMKVPALAGDANVQKMSEEDIATRIKSNGKHPPTVKGIGADDLTAVATFVKGLAAK